MTRRALALCVLLLAVLAAGCESGPRVARGCPTALLIGTLAERDGVLVVVSGDDRHGEKVAWPADHRVQDDAGNLVVMDGSGAVVAREGEEVNLTGGQSPSQPDVFEVCEIEVGEPPPA